MGNVRGVLLLRKITITVDDATLHCPVSYTHLDVYKRQAKKYSGLNFARKIRFISPGVSSKIWYCGTSIGLSYDLSLIHI